ncbi:MAG: hypothetical protein AAB596_00500 [Patescibacteria group bacterium]
MKSQNYLKFKIFAFYAVIFLFTILNSPFMASAAGLIPCEGASCKFCDLLTLGENIINFALYSVAIPLTVIFIIYGGFVIMISRDSASELKRGGDVIKAAVIGLLIALAAWLIIKELLMLLTGQPFNPLEIRTAIHC